MMALLIHRASMIACLPFACAFAIVIGPMLALEEVARSFKRHWNEVE